MTLEAVGRKRLIRHCVSAESTGSTICTIPSTHRVNQSVNACLTPVVVSFCTATGRYWSHRHSEIPTALPTAPAWSQNPIFCVNITQSVSAAPPIRFAIVMVSGRLMKSPGHSVSPIYASARIDAPDERRRILIGFRMRLRLKYRRHVSETFREVLLQPSAVRPREHSELPVLTCRSALVERVRVVEAGRQCRTDGTL